MASEYSEHFDLNSASGMEPEPLRIKAPGLKQSFDAGDKRATQVDVDGADDELTQRDGREEGEDAHSESAGDVANGVCGDGWEKRPEKDEETAAGMVQFFADMGELLRFEMLIDLPNRGEKIDQGA